MRSIIILSYGTPELEPVENFLTGPVRPVTGRLKKVFKPVKTGNIDLHIRSFTVVNRRNLKKHLFLYFWLTFSLIVRKKYDAIGVDINKGSERKTSALSL